MTFIKWPWIILFRFIAIFFSCFKKVFLFFNYQAYFGYYPCEENKGSSCLLLNGNGKIRVASPTEQPRFPLCPVFALPRSLPGNWWSHESSGFLRVSHEFSGFSSVEPWDWRDTSELHLCCLGWVFEYFDMCLFSGRQQLCGWPWISDWILLNEKSFLTLGSEETVLTLITLEESPSLY